MQKLCYAAMNYTDEKGVVHTLVQIYTYRYSALFTQADITEQQEQFIRQLGFIKLQSNLYRTYRAFDLAQLNYWLIDNNLITFSNSVFCFLEEHLYEFGGIYFESDHKPRVNRNLQYDNYGGISDMKRRANKFLEESGKNGNRYKDNSYCSQTQKSNNSVKPGYNPRRRFTGSEDETAGLWYDFD